MTVSPKKLESRYASIDIGSNAIRLFVGEVSKSGHIRVLADERASVRLGKDAFSSGYIRPMTQAELERALKRFQALCSLWRVRKISAVGTSALRDSSNHKKILKSLRAHTGIQVRLINGTREAALLFKAVSHALNLDNQDALLMDMGGGSLEVVLSRKGRMNARQSLPLGSVRLLAHVGKKPNYEDFALWVRAPLYRLRLDLLGRNQKLTQILVGTGGNLRALGKLCFRLGYSRTRNRFQRAHLEMLTQKLFKLSMKERMDRFQLKKDRADVILPAAVVTLELMRIFEMKEIMVPNVGLKNGLFWDAIERRRSN